MNIYSICGNTADIKTVENLETALKDSFGETFEEVDINSKFTEMGIKAYASTDDSVTEPITLLLFKDDDVETYYTGEVIFSGALDLSDKQTDFLMDEVKSVKKSFWGSEDEVETFEINI